MRGSPESRSKEVHSVKMSTSQPGPVAWACKSSSLTATLLDVHALDKLQSWLELVVGDRLGPPEVSGYQLGEKCGDQRDAEEPDGGECPAPDDR